MEGKKSQLIVDDWNKAREEKKLLTRDEQKQQDDWRMTVKNGGEV